MKKLNTVCCIKLPGVFMSDAWRNCMKPGKVLIEGKLYCRQHAKMKLKKVSNNGT